MMAVCRSWTSALGTGWLTGKRTMGEGACCLVSPFSLWRTPAGACVVLLSARYQSAGYQSVLQGCHSMQFE